jgi:hypothetical protein
MVRIARGVLPGGLHLVTQRGNRGNWGVALGLLAGEYGIGGGVGKMEPSDHTAAEPPGHWERCGKHNQHRRARRPLRERLNPTDALITGVLAGALAFLLSVIVGHRFDTGPVSPGEAMSRILFYFVLTFVAFYLFQLLGFKSYGPRTMICNQCYRVKNEDREPNCSCGGQFELLDNWEWVEDDDSDAKPETSSEDLKKV